MFLVDEKACLQTGPAGAGVCCCVRGEARFSSLGPLHSPFINDPLAPPKAQKPRGEVRVQHRCLSGTSGAAGTQQTIYSYSMKVALEGFAASFHFSHCISS